MGLSDKPQAFPYVLQNHIDHLRACLDHLRLENFDLVVHDWGGPIGLGAALEAPRQLRRVVITNTAAWPSERIPWRIALCRLPILGDIIIRGFNGFAGAATRMAVSGQLPPAVRFGYTWPYGTWTNRIATLRFVQDIPKSPGHPSWDRLKDLENRLSALREKAALLWWGGQDFCFDDAFLSEWQAVLPGAGVHRLPGAGHYVFEEADEADYRVLTEFLTNAQVPRRGVGPDGTRL
jgi:haloalkane dehalogenase